MQIEMMRLHVKLVAYECLDSYDADGEPYDSDLGQVCIPVKWTYQIHYDGVYQLSWTRKITVDDDRLPRMEQVLLDHYPDISSKIGQTKCVYEKQVLEAIEKMITDENVELKVSLRTDQNEALLQVETGFRTDLIDGLLETIRRVVLIS